MSDRRGFTLIEILVALVVLGLLIVGLTQGTRLGLRAWNAQARIVAEHDQLDATDRTLRQLLSHLSAGLGSESAPLSGRAEQLGFVTELPEAITLPTHVVDAKLFLDDRHRLILSWRLHLHEKSLVPPARPVETVLLTGVERLVFGYRGAEPGAAGWRDDWSEPNPPGLIRVHLAFAKGDPRHWPDIVVAPMIAEAAG